MNTSGVSSTSKPRPTGLPIPIGVLPERPLVSILIANFNYEAYVEEAVETALRQTYDKIEIIVCDDGSTDNSPAILDRLEAFHPSVEVIHKTNGGMASAFNAAFRASRGHVVCFLDADDLFTRSKVERVVSLLQEEPTLGYVHHPILLVDQHREVIQRVPFGISLDGGDMSRRIRDRGGRWMWSPTSAISLHRDLAEYVFPIPEPDLTWCADGYASILSASISRIGVIDEALSLYRVHGRNAVVQKKRTVQHAQSLIDAIHLQINAVNETLSNWDLHSLHIDVEKNLAVDYQRLAVGILGHESRRSLMADYLHMIPAMVRDDLYGRSWRRLIPPIAYGFAILLPKQAVSWWLTQTTGHTRVKHRIQTALAKFRRRFGR